MEHIYCGILLSYNYIDFVSFTYICIKYTTLMTSAHFKEFCKRLVRSRQCNGYGQLHHNNDSSTFAQINNVASVPLTARTFIHSRHLDRYWEELWQIAAHVHYVQNFGGFKCHFRCWYKPWNPKSLILLSKVYQFSRGSGCSYDAIEYLGSDNLWTSISRVSKVPSLYIFDFTVQLQLRRVVMNQNKI